MGIKPGNIAEIKKNFLPRQRLGQPERDDDASRIKAWAISLSIWGAALAFSESTRTTTRLDPMAFRVASVQSSRVEMSRAAIQHFRPADSSFSQIASAMLFPYVHD